MRFYRYRKREPRLPRSAPLKSIGIHKAVPEKKHGAWDRNPFPFPVLFFDPGNALYFEKELRGCCLPPAPRRCN